MEGCSRFPLELMEQAFQQKPGCWNNRGFPVSALVRLSSQIVPRGETATTRRAMILRVPTGPAWAEPERLPAMMLTHSHTTKPDECLRRGYQAPRRPAALQNSMFFDERRNQRGQESSIREGLWWPPFLNSLTALGAGNDPTRRNRHSVPQGGIPVMAI
jgi:hypothetical protein